MSDQHWLLAYDIANPRRLRRVQRVVARRARRIQYSLYEFSGSSTQLEEWMNQIQSLIDPAMDKLRIIPSPHDARQRHIGASSLGTGMFLFDDQGRPQ